MKRKSNVLKVYCIDGWSAFKGGKLSKVVEESIVRNKIIIGDYFKCINFKHQRGHLIGGNHQVTRIALDLIQDYPSDCLLLCGKSLGGKRAIDAALKYKNLWEYKKKGLLLVDANWPKSNDWRPNLNDVRLDISSCGFDYVINFVSETRRQSGCFVHSGGYCENNIVSKSDHRNIVSSGLVKFGLDKIIRLLTGN
jgi:hypothetical protein